MRAILFGHPAGQLLRWMGSKGYTYDKALVLVRKHKLQLQDITVYSEISNGKNAHKFQNNPAYKLAKLSPEEEQEIRRAIDEL